jgi:hypothetical protein
MIPPDGPDQDEFLLFSVIVARSLKAGKMYPLFYPAIQQKTLSCRVLPSAGAAGTKGYTLIT